MRVLDLFCGAGGAGMGYHQAGFDEVVGVDIVAQNRYPFVFAKGDAIEFLKARGREFDFIHASPPCQFYSNTRKLNSGKAYPDLIIQTRQELLRLGKPFVIENVVGAPLHNPVTLCGAMFGLRVYRHRLFETSFAVHVPDHPGHTAPLIKMGRPVREGDFIHVVGHFSNVEYASRAMAINWMRRDEMAQAIPPAYTRFVGDQYLKTQKVLAQ